MPRLIDEIVSKIHKIKNKTDIIFIYIKIKP